MQVKILLASFVLALVPAFASGQSRDADFPPVQYDFGKLTDHLQRLQANMVSKEAAQNEWVIGQDDPNEVVTITGSYVHHGNLAIVNNGVLNLDIAEFQI